MRIMGCDLHSRQQTLAMLDTTTGEVEKTTLKHEGNNVPEFYSTLLRQVRVGIEATRSMLWLVNLMEEVIRQRFEPPSQGSRNMIGEMPTYFCHCWQKSVFRRSGYLRKNSLTCGPYYGTAISGADTDANPKCRPLL